MLSIESILFAIGKIPWWLRWVLAVIIIPNLIVGGVIFFFFIAPWHEKDVSASVHRERQRTDSSIKLLVERQSLQYQNLHEGILRVQEQQNVMYKAMIDRK